MRKVLPTIGALALIVTGCSGNNIPIKAKGGFGFGDSASFIETIGISNPRTYYTISSPLSFSFNTGGSEKSSKSSVSSNNTTSSSLSSSSSVNTSSSSSSSQSSLSSVSSSSIPSEPEPEPEPQEPFDYFYCEPYGPFALGASDFTASFQYRVNIPDQQIIERIRLFINNSVVAATNHARFSYSDNALISTSFNIPIKDYLTNDGITLKFEILNMSYSILKTYSATFFPLPSTSPNYNYLKNNIYQANNIGFYGDGQAMKSISEIYDFTHVGDYLYNENYYKLSLDPITIYYDSAFPLTYSSIYLRYKDSDNIFPYLSHDSSSYITIPLKAEVSDKQLHLMYANNFYVNERTLHISQNARYGFKITSDFYLPINGKDSLNNHYFYLDITNLGKSKINASFPVKYRTDKSLVGVSDDGINYVSGGSK